MTINEALKILDLTELKDIRSLKSQRNFLLQCFHPDKHTNPDFKIKAESKTKKIIEAFSYLEKFPNENSNDFKEQKSSIVTVKDRFNLDEDKLYILSGNSSYLKACYNFYNQVKDRNIQHMTKNQLAWLGKIKKYLDEN